MGETTLARVRCRAKALGLPRWQVLFASCQVSVLIFAFILRTYHLGRLSLWYDEGVSWSFARVPLGQLLHKVEDYDLNPPLYPILLHFWIIVGGSRAYALRFLSVIPGTLTVALTMTLARRSFQQPVAMVLAGVFSGASIFLIDYSQEARAYALATWFVLLATYALVRGVAGESKWWVVYALGIALALYSHYATVVFCPVHGLWVMVTARRKIRPYMVSSMVAALLFLPWLEVFLHQLAVVHAGSNIFWSGTVSPFLAPGRALAAIWSRPGAFSGEDRQLVVVTAAVIGVLVGLAVARRRWHIVVLAALSVTVPLLEMAVATVRTPVFLDRYLLPVTPLASVLAASIADARLGKLHRGTPWRFYVLALFCLGIVGGTVQAVHAERHAERGAVEIKDGDMRAAVAYVRQWARPGDAILLDQDTSPVFTYYYDGFLGPKEVGWFPVLREFSRPDDFSALANVLTRAARDHRRLWVIWWHAGYADATHYVRDALLEHGQLLSQYVGVRGFTIDLYRIRPGTRFDPAPHPARAEHVIFGKRLRFFGSTLEHRVVAAGQPVVVDTWFSLLAPTTHRLVGVLRLERDGNEWAGANPPLASYTYATPHWRVGLAVPGRLLLPVDGATPPGAYHVLLGVYDVDGQRTLAAMTPRGGTLPPLLDIGTVTITMAPHPIAVRPPLRVVERPLSAHIQLWGTGKTPAMVQQGGTLMVTLLWRATGKPQWNIEVEPELVAGDGAVYQPGVPVPLTPGFPTTRWPGGAVFRQQLAVTVPPLFPPGAAALTLHAVGEPGAGQPSVQVGDFVVTPLSRLMQRPLTIGQPLHDLFGAAALLAGIRVTPTIVTPGSAVVVQLTWYCEAPLRKDYTVFVHLLDAHNLIGGRQQDGPPDGGTAPTSSWVPGQWIVDRHTVPIPRGTLPGSYRIEVGLYTFHGISFHRLLLADGSSSAIVGTVQVR